jgi:hypothetical protein
MGREERIKDNGPYGNGGWISPYFISHCFYLYILAKPKLDENPLLA